MESLPIQGHRRLVACLESEMNDLTSGEKMELMKLVAATVTAKMESVCAVILEGPQPSGSWKAELVLWLQENGLDSWCDQVRLRLTEMEAEMVFTYANCRNMQTAAPSMRKYWVEEMLVRYLPRG
jgi:hypothetical protein